MSDNLSLPDQPRSRVPSLSEQQQPRSRLPSLSKWISSYMPKTTYGQIERQDSVDQLSDLSTSLRGPGISFLVKYMGSEETAESKGKHIVSAAMDQLNMGLKNKKRFIMNISVAGIKLIDTDTQEVVELHAIHRISQCAHDVSPDRLRLISYVAYNQGSDRYYCHMFKFQDSAQPIHETIGKAFEEAYNVHKEKEAQKAAASLNVASADQPRERTASASSRPQLTQVDEFSEFQTAPSQQQPQFPPQPQFPQQFSQAPAPAQDDFNSFSRARVQSFSQAPAAQPEQRRTSFVSNAAPVALAPPP
eukprot:Opistho-2@20576